MEDAHVPDMTRLEFTLRKPRKDTDISFQILDVLTPYLQPGSIAAPQTAAESIDELTPQYRRERGEEPGPADASAEDIEEFLWELWSIVYEVATQIPHSHPAQDKLVSLLRELKSLETPISVTIWGNETQLWTTLPLLGPALREFYDTDLNTCNPDEELEAWLSRESFLARLHAAGVQDLTNFAVWSMTEALERDAYQSAKGKKILQCVAAQWIIYAGPKLYAFAQKGEQDKDFLQITKPGPAYDGAPGLPLERWTFWKRRFGEEPEDKKLKQVAASMQKIEDGEA